MPLVIRSNPIGLEIMRHDVGDTELLELINTYRGETVADRHAISLLVSEFGVTSEDGRATNIPQHLRYDFIARLMTSTADDGPTRRAIDLFVGALPPTARQLFHARLAQLREEHREDINAVAD
jgi:hypothetical protein